MPYREKKIDHTLGRSVRQSMRSLSVSVKKLAEITAGKSFFFICVLKGSFMFAADLIREIDLPCQIDFMSVSQLRWGKDDRGS